MTPIRRPRLAAAAIAVAMLVTGTVAASPRAVAAPGWASPEKATIHPGVQTRTEGSQCTANFVFFDGSEVYLGQAAHCASQEGSFAINGCQTRTHRLGTPVQIQGAEHAGTLVYSSWVTMQARRETDVDRCLYNDFALVRVHPDDRAKVNPTVPVWGGPVGLTGEVTSGGKAYSYGNSSLRFGLAAFSPKEGQVLETSRSGWTHTVYTVTPGLPGDSGSAYLAADGSALGVLSTLEAAPYAGSNGVTDLRLALDYLARHGGPTVRLATGTERFTPGLLPSLPL